MSDLLTIGASGVRAYSTALAAIGNNVSNADTPGYTRRTVSMVEDSASGASQFGIINRVQFGGVVAATVNRAWDDYMANSVRTTSSAAGSSGMLSTWLSSAENALNDGSAGVGETATSVFDAGDALAADAGSTANRKVFLANLDQTAQAFRTTSSALKSVSDGIATQAQTVVQTVNADLDGIDKVNAALRAVQPGTSAQADLMDQRDRLIDDLSTNIGINVAVGQDGTATVTLAGSGTQLTKSPGISNGARLTMSVAGNGTLSIQAVVNGKPQALAGLDGKLGGLVSSAGTVADRRDSLDSMANDFASAINAWNAGGQTPGGTAGGALLSATGAADIKITTSDPNAIAAASGTASNGNLLALSNLRGSNGLEQRWSAMVTDQGQMVANAKSQDTAASSAATAASSARDKATGVDLDTEAAELLKFQQAYSGAAKVIQVAKETMQSILDIF